MAGSPTQLHTDYLDSLLLHAPRHARQMGAVDWQARAALEAAYERGAVRHIGASNMDPHHLRRLC